MADPDTVIVYNFRVFDTTRKRYVAAMHKAPRHVVQALDGVVVEGSAEEVGAAELNAEGLYRRVATGWGELGPG